MRLIRLPAHFYRDHEERDLPTPCAVRRTRRHVHVSADDPHLAELRSDAAYYADPNGPDGCGQGLATSARATLRAIDRTP